MARPKTTYAIAALFGLLSIIKLSWKSLQYSKIFVHTFVLTGFLILLECSYDILLSVVSNYVIIKFRRTTNTSKVLHTDKDISYSNSICGVSLEFNPFQIDIPGFAIISCTIANINIGITQFKLCLNLSGGRCEIIGLRDTAKFLYDFFLKYIDQENINDIEENQNSLKDPNLNKTFLNPKSTKNFFNKYNIETLITRELESSLVNPKQLSELFFANLINDSIVLFNDKKESQENKHGANKSEDFEENNIDIKKNTVDPSLTLTTTQNDSTPNSFLTYLKNILFFLGYHVKKLFPVIYYYILNWFCFWKINFNDFNLYIHTSKGSLNLLLNNTAIQPVIHYYRCETATALEHSNFDLRLKIKGNLELHEGSICIVNINNFLVLASLSNLAITSKDITLVLSPTLLEVISLILRETGISSVTKPDDTESKQNDLVDEFSELINRLQELQTLLPTKLSIPSINKNSNYSSIKICITLPIIYVNIISKKPLSFIISKYRFSDKNFKRLVQLQDTGKHDYKLQLILKEFDAYINELFFDNKCISNLDFTDFCFDEIVIDDIHLLKNSSFIKGPDGSRSGIRIDSIDLISFRPICKINKIAINNINNINFKSIKIITHAAGMHGLFILIKDALPIIINLPDMYQNHCEKKPSTNSKQIKEISINEIILEYSLYAPCDKEFFVIQSTTFDTHIRLGVAPVIDIGESILLVKDQGISIINGSLKSDMAWNSAVKNGLLHLENSQIYKDIEENSYEWWHITSSMANLNNPAHINGTLWLKPELVIQELLLSQFITTEWEIGRCKEIHINLSAPCLEVVIDPVYLCLSPGPCSAILSLSELIIEELRIIGLNIQELNELYLKYFYSFKNKNNLILKIPDHWLTSINCDLLLTKVIETYHEQEILETIISETEKPVNNPCNITLKEFMVRFETSGDFEAHGISEACEKRINFLRESLFNNNEEENILHGTNGINKAFNMLLEACSAEKSLLEPFFESRSCSDFRDSDGDSPSIYSTISSTSNKKSCYRHMNDSLCFPSGINSDLSYFPSEDLYISSDNVLRVDIYGSNLVCIENKVTLTKLTVSSQNTTNEFIESYSWRTEPNAVVFLESITTESDNHGKFLVFDLLEGLTINGLRVIINSAIGSVAKVIYMLTSMVNPIHICQIEKKPSSSNFKNHILLQNSVLSVPSKEVSAHAVLDSIAVTVTVVDLSYNCMITIPHVEVFLINTKDIGTRYTSMFTTTHIKRMLQNLGYTSILSIEGIEMILCSTERYRYNSKVTPISKLSIVNRVQSIKVNLCSDSVHTAIQLSTHFTNLVNTINKDLDGAKSWKQNISLAASSLTKAQTQSAIFLTYCELMRVLGSTLTTNVNDGKKDKPKKYTHNKVSMTNDIVFCGSPSSSVIDEKSENEDFSVKDIDLNKEYLSNILPSISTERDISNKIKKNENTFLEDESLKNSFSSSGDSMMSQNKNSNQIILIDSKETNNDNQNINNYYMNNNDLETSDLKNNINIDYSNIKNNEQNSQKNIEFKLEFERNFDVINLLNKGETNFLENKNLLDSESIEEVNIFSKDCNSSLEVRKNLDIIDEPLFNTTMKENSEIFNSDKTIDKLNERIIQYDFKNNEKIENQKIESGKCQQNIDKEKNFDDNEYQLNIDSDLSPIIFESATYYGSLVPTSKENNTRATQSSININYNQDNIYHKNKDLNTETRISENINSLENSINLENEPSSNGNKVFDGLLEYPKIDIKNLSNYSELSNDEINKLQTIDIDETNRFNKALLVSTKDNIESNMSKKNMSILNNDYLELEKKDIINTIENSIQFSDIKNSKSDIFSNKSENIQKIDSVIVQNETERKHLTKILDDFKNNINLSYNDEKNNVISESNTNSTNLLLKKESSIAQPSIDNFNNIVNDDIYVSLKNENSHLDSDSINCEKDNYHLLNNIPITKHLLSAYSDTKASTIDIVKTSFKDNNLQTGIFSSNFITSKNESNLDDENHVAILENKETELLIPIGKNLDKNDNITLEKNLDVNIYTPITNTNLYLNKELPDNKSSILKINNKDMLLSRNDIAEFSSIARDVNSNMNIIDSIDNITKFNRPVLNSSESKVTVTTNKSQFSYSKESSSKENSIDSDSKNSHEDSNSCSLDEVLTKDIDHINSSFISESEDLDYIFIDKAFEDIPSYQNTDQDIELLDRLKAKANIREINKSNIIYSDISDFQELQNTTYRISPAIIAFSDQLAGSQSSKEVQSTVEYIDRTSSVISNIQILENNTESISSDTKELRKQNDIFKCNRQDSDIEFTSLEHISSIPNQDILSNEYIETDCQLIKSWSIPSKNEIALPGIATIFRPYFIHSEHFQSKTITDNLLVTQVIDDGIELSISIAEMKISLLGGNALLDDYVRELYRRCPVWTSAFQIHRPTIYNHGLEVFLYNINMSLGEALDIKPLPVLNTSDQWNIADLNALYCRSKWELKLKVSDFGVIDNVLLSPYTFLLRRDKRIPSSHPILSATCSFGPSDSSCMISKPQGVLHTPEGTPVIDVNLAIEPIIATISRQTVDFIQTFIEGISLESEPTKSNVEQSSSNSSAKNVIDVHDSPTTLFRRFAISKIKISVEYMGYESDLSNLRKGDILEILNLWPRIGEVVIEIGEFALPRISIVDDAITNLLNHIRASLSPKQVVSAVANVGPLADFNRSIWDTIMQATNYQVSTTDISLTHIFTALFARLGVTGISVIHTGASILHGSLFSLSTMADSLRGEFKNHDNLDIEYFASLSREIRKGLPTIQKNATFLEKAISVLANMDELLWARQVRSKHILSRSSQIRKAQLKSQISKSEEDAELAEVITMTVNETSDIQIIRNSVTINNIENLSKNNIIKTVPITDISPTNIPDIIDQYATTIEDKVTDELCTAKFLKYLSQAAKQSPGKWDDSLVVRKAHRAAVVAAALSCSRGSIGKSRLSNSTLHITFQDEIQDVSCSRNNIGITAILNSFHNGREIMRDQIKSTSTSSLPAVLMRIGLGLPVAVLRPITSITEAAVSSIRQAEYITNPRSGESESIKFR